MTLASLEADRLSCLPGARGSQATGMALRQGLGLGLGWSLECRCAAPGSVFLPHCCVIEIQTKSRQNCSTQRIPQSNKIIYIYIYIWYPPQGPTFLKNSLVFAVCSTLFWALGRAMKKTHFQGRSGSFRLDLNRFNPI